jgi:hypothetical protein
LAPRVRSLSVVLNKPEYELASASATNYVSKVHLKNGNFSVEGTLGDFALQVAHVASLQLQNLGHIFVQKIYIEQFLPYNSEKELYLITPKRAIKAKFVNFFSLIQICP